MFCSGCGHALPPGQGFCSHCGRPAVVAVPAVPGLQFQVQNYAGKVRALSVCWFVYAGLIGFTGLIGLTFANAFLAGHFGNWAQGPWGNNSFPREWLGPALIHFLWIVTVGRVVLAVVAGWGLMERTQWGRIVAIVAAVLSLIKFPFGTAIGIWTLVVLLGYQNTTLYEQLDPHP